MSINSSILFCLHNDFLLCQKTISGLQVYRVPTLVQTSMSVVVVSSVSFGSRENANVHNLLFNPVVFGVFPRSGFRASFVITVDQVNEHHCNHDMIHASIFN